jgi:hypothetical protein
MWRFYRALYLLSWHLIEIDVEHENGIVFLINSLVVALALNIFDAVFFIVAFRTTGFFRGIGYIGRHEMRSIHWWIRLLFAGACVFLSFISAFSVFRPAINTIGVAIFNLLIGVKESVIGNIMDIINSAMQNLAAL